MKVDTFKCDSCGIVKGETNHWYRVGAQAESLGIYTWQGGDATDDDKHLCSDSCVIKMVQTWLSAQTAKPRESAPALQTETDSANARDEENPTLTPPTVSRIGTERNV